MEAVQLAPMLTVKFLVPILEMLISKIFIAYLETDITDLCKDERIPNGENILSFNCTILKKLGGGKLFMGKISEYYYYFK